MKIPIMDDNLTEFSGVIRRAFSRTKLSVKVLYFLRSLMETYYTSSESFNDFS